MASLTHRILRRLRAASPLDWTRGAGRPVPLERPARVDVIVPVYHAAGELARCLERVTNHTDLERHRVVLAIDGPQPSEVEKVVASFLASHAAATRLLRSDVRRGFPATVNAGLAGSRNDAVLLNSDAFVTSGWLEGLIDAAMSCGDAGTVTPLSNNATLASVPRPFIENELPSGFDADSFAALVRRTSAREYPRLPTGVGVCLYVRRALVDDIGILDDATFSFGYGEENDFCFRALARGWLHLLDDATFVEHLGHRSFGASRHERIRLGEAALERRQPAYFLTIARFMNDDPVRHVRERIVSALRARRPRVAAKSPARVVHLVHGWPPAQHGGAELYAWWLVRNQQTWRDVSVYARGTDPERQNGEAVERNDDGIRVRFVTNNFTQRDPWSRNALRDRTVEHDFATFLREERPGLVHIHHLAGHTFSLARIARRSGAAVVIQLQDWWPICARVNLLRPDWTRCSGPGFEKCGACVQLTGVFPRGLTNRLLHLERRRHARAALACADAFVMGSDAIRRDYGSAGVLPEGVPVRVVPYGIAIEASASPRREAAQPLRFGCVGAVLPYKGLHVAVEAFRGIDRGAASLQIWGNAGASVEYTEKLRALAGIADVRFEGPFAEEEKPRIFASIDVLLVPSIGLESFGLAAREAIACGVPVIASRDGALAELPEGTGALIEPGSVPDWRSELERIIAEPSLVDCWRAALPRPKRAEQHAKEIEETYRIVCERRVRR